LKHRSHSAHIAVPVTADGNREAAMALTLYPVGPARKTLFRNAGLK
jgi:hypothetical protein